MTEVTPTTWRRSSHSSNGTNCVEVAGVAAADRWVRDSKDPDGAVLRLPVPAWAVFVQATATGGFR